LCSKIIDGRLHSRDLGIRERDLNRLLFFHPDIRQAHTVGRQDARHWMKPDLFHVQHFSDFAGVLPGGTAE